MCVTHATLVGAVQDSHRWSGAHSAARRTRILPPLSRLKRAARRLANTGGTGDLAMLAAPPFPQPNHSAALSTRPMRRHRAGARRRSPIGTQISPGLMRAWRLAQAYSLPTARRTGPLASPRARAPQYNTLSTHATISARGYRVIKRARAQYSV